MAQNGLSMVNQMHFTARNDYAFKKLFGTEENKDIMIEFVSLITGISKSCFQYVAIENSELHPKFFDDKAGRLDIKICLADGRKINLEMQNIYFDYYAKRSIFYWSELLQENFKKGFDYDSLNKCITINIINQPFKLSKKLHAVYKIQEREEGIILDDVLEIHFLDLTKIPESNLTAVEKWLMFIKTEDKEVRAMLAQGNPLLAKANKVMDSFYLNDEERVLYLAACKYESDRVSMINESERKGIEKGRSEGSYQKAVETAKNLIDIGLSVENIAKATGLSYEEVEKCR